MTVPIDSQVFKTSRALEAASSKLAELLSQQEALQNQLVGLSKQIADMQAAVSDGLADLRTKLSVEAKV